MKCYIIHTVTVERNKTSHCCSCASTPLLFLLVFRFSTLLLLQSPEEMDNLAEQFVELQLLEDNAIPEEVWNKATVSVEEIICKKYISYHRIDVLWQYISTIQLYCHILRFPKLSKVAMSVLVIPHSNAEERIFSMMRKNKTAFRPGLYPNKEHFRVF